MPMTSSITKTDGSSPYFFKIPFPVNKEIIKKTNDNAVNIKMLLNSFINKGKMQKKLAKVPLATGIKPMKKKLLNKREKKFTFISKLTISFLLIIINFFNFTYKIL